MQEKAKARLREFAPAARGSTQPRLHLFLHVCTYSFCFLPGIVQLHVNGWIEVSYCMPQKVHKRVNANLFVEPDAVIECMNALRPYHSLLLLQGGNN